MCSGDFACDYATLSCALGYGTTWGVTPTFVSVPSLDSTGSAWDAFGGAPDLKVCFVVGDATATPSCTGEATDVFSSTFTGGPTVTATPAEFAAFFGVFVYDVDVSSDDIIGGCTHTFDPWSALPTTEQTMDCLASASFGYAGFTVHYRLAPY